MWRQHHSLHRRSLIVFPKHPGELEHETEWIMRRRSSLMLAAAAVTASVIGGSVPINAAPPAVMEDPNEITFVRLLGDPSSGDVKFQYGWFADMAELTPEGYWLGIYDVTNSHYVWAFDSQDTEPGNVPRWGVTPPIDFSRASVRNAKITEDLPNGTYKVNFFVRDSYGEPTTNLAEIEFEFQVTDSMG